MSRIYLYCKTYAHKRMCVRMSVYVCVYASWGCGARVCGGRRGGARDMT